MSGMRRTADSRSAGAAIVKVSVSSVVISSLFVGAGGFAGSVARYEMGLLSLRLQCTWPFGTLSSNVLGCLIIGCIMALSERGGILSPEARLALATGFCGGFTTMSSMIYEVTAMLRGGAFGQAFLYGAGTLVFCMAAFLAGDMLMRAIVK